MAADVLATQGAKASAAMVHTLFSLLKYFIFSTSRIKLFPSTYLSTTLMFVELHKTRDTFDYVGLFIHDNEGGSAECSLGFHQGIEVHQNITANPGEIFFFKNQ